MVSSIVLGNASQQNGRNVITGTSSGGIDTESLIKALSDAKRLPAVKLEARIKANTDKATAYTELKDILTRFKDAANFLRNPPGVGNATQNVFKYRTADVTSNGTTAGSNYLGVNAEPGVAVSTYDVTVDQLATYNVKLTNTFALATADTVAAGAGQPFNAGTYNFGAAGIPVTIAAGDTLNQIASKINSVSAQSDVTATVIKVSNGNYRLSLKSLETGAAQNYTTPVGFASGGFVSEIDAVDSQVTIDGTTVIRSTNAISDAVNGVTFSLKAVTPLTDTLHVDVQPDTEVTKKAILNFVDAYNEFKIFSAKQTEIGTDGKPKETAILNNSNTLRSTLSRVSAEVATVVDGLATGVADRLADIGISFNDFPGDDKTPFVRNVLNVDENKLDAALAGKFEEVRHVFEFDYASDNANLAVFSRDNKLGVSAVTLNLSRAFNTFTATYNTAGGPVTINLDGQDLAGGGGTVLKGQAGTVLEGLTLIFASTADATVNLSLSQGVGDRVFNSLDTILSDNNGLLKTETTSLSDTNTRLQKEIDRIDEQVSNYREQLLKKFSALEKAISQANTLLQSLTANANAQLAGVNS